MGGGDSTPIGFPSTLWTLVRGVAGPEVEEAQRREALGRLCGIYWRPVYWFIRCSGDRDPAAVEDLAQAFFVHILETDFISKAEPGRGRFRSFLKASLRNFLTDQFRSEQAARRGGRTVRFSLEDAERGAEGILAAGKELGPDKVFLQQWVKTVVDSAVGEVRDRLISGGREKYYDVFRRYDMEGASEASYQDVADELGIKENDVRNYLRVARALFRDCVRARVRETVGSDSDLKDELRELFGFLD